MRFPRLLIVSAFAATSCFSAGAGREPDLKRLYFPVGLALDASHSRLFVASSDFDLQFSGGSILALDLPRIRGLVPRECRVDADCDSGQACDTSDVSGAQASWWCLPKGKSACELWGARSIGEQLDYPGRCEGVELTAPQDGGSSLVTSAVRTSAFATELLYLSRPGGERSEGRLYAPMRGDSTLHWVEVDADGKLDCGEGDGGGCDDAHRVHARAETNNQVKLEMPVEPFAIAATPSGDALVVTHQTTNRVSLFTQDWSSSKGPRLSAIEEMAAAGPMGLGALPATQGVPDG